MKKERNMFICSEALGRSAHVWSPHHVWVSVDSGFIPRVICGFMLQKLGSLVKLWIKSKVSWAEIHRQLFLWGSDLSALYNVWSSIISNINTRFIHRYPGHMWSGLMTLWTSVTCVSSEWEMKQKETNVGSTWGSSLLFRRWIPSSAGVWLAVAECCHSFSVYPEPPTFSPPHQYGPTSFCAALPGLWPETFTPLWHKQKISTGLFSCLFPQRHFYTERPFCFPHYSDWHRTLVSCSLFHSPASGLRQHRRQTNELNQIQDRLWNVEQSVAKGENTCRMNVEL